MLKLKRMWINQPSTLQPDHKLDGTNVLAEESDGEFTDIWFLSGPVVSQRIARSSLSLGWVHRKPLTAESA